MKLKRLNTLCDKWSDFDDSYLVGDDGHLYRLKPNGELYQLKSGDVGGGGKYPYQQVRGNFGSSRKVTIKVHRAVALAFIPKPFNATDVDHRNNDKADNRADNLQWLTHRANIRKIFTDRMVMA